jgi:hypothetical protein
MDPFPRGIYKAIFAIIAMIICLRLKTPIMGKKEKDMCLLFMGL